MEGRPLPAFLPRLRDRLLYHDYHAAKATKSTLRQGNLFPGHIRDGGDEVKEEKSIHTDSTSELLNKGDKSGFESEEDLGAAAGPMHVDGHSVGIELDELNLDMLLNEQLPAHSTAVIALSSLLFRVDEMIDITRTLCGQATFRGYEGLQQDYLDREEKAIGGVRP
ncbi:hypothetical protein JR316_0001392 [Psilocybe cubensis]|uniref:Uncharacterized protein n=2 Tax=Psilocybe cubensis TaxID=181762 RepID=A0ACB8HHX4_PSICU|nr:hypothetical protein JR316_0001392 [Psilocybe cubensis]KAH9487319.1 hypothetical protein JR316_0001392 [Psilocybe cubensis]